MRANFCFSASFMHASMRLCSPWVMALVFAVSGVDASQRKIIADFEDAGTWRVIDQRGSSPGAWFAGVTWMGGSQNARFADEWTGELRFDFAEEATERRRLAFRRVKMSQVSGFLDGVEFDADSSGHPVSMRFTLIDSLKKRHTTPPVKLGQAGWRRHRLELNADAWSGFDKVRFPAAVEQVILESDAGGAGAVFIDDLAITGTFSSRNRFSISPLYSGINYDPGDPVTLEYRVRNAGDAASLAGSITVKSVSSGGEVFSGRAMVEVSAHGQARLRFEAPVLPVGAYEAVVEITGDDVTISYEDSFGVFQPNGGRVNRSPMWFGVQDQTMWQGEGENRLHLEWMKAIGIDINRAGMTANRFNLSVERGLEGWRSHLAPFDEAGIDSVLLYFETPSALIAPGKGNRTPPTDLEAFERYAADVGAFFGAFSGIKYIEFWNEPDIGFFHGTIDEYWDMFAAFSRGVRSTAPHVKLATGGSTVKHPREKAGFSESLYSENGDIYDVAAFHAHGTTGAYVERQSMVEGWQAAGGLEKPIANTESGERSGYDARGRAEQAITLVKKMAFSKSRPRSEFHIWFTLQDYWDMDPDADDSFGLVTSDNRAKPSLVAYNELIRQLANTKPVAEPAFPAGVAGHAFKREDGRHVLVCWAADGSGGGVLWLRSEGAAERVDMFGAVERLNLSGGAGVSVAKAPIYLVFDAEPVFLAESERPLSAPAEIYRDVNSPARFDVVARNVGDKAGTHRLRLIDAAGAVTWEGGGHIAGGEERRFPVSIPANPEAGMTSAEYRLELGRDDAETLTLSLWVHGSHAITRDPATIRLDTAQDVHELTFDPSIPAWKNPTDLSVNARIGRGSGELIFRFEVSDDRHVQESPDGQLWRGDSVQVAFFNPENSAHTLFDLGLRNGEAVAWCHKNADPALQGRWTIPLNIRREGGRTLYEARVPNAHLGLPDRPADGHPVRFSFLVNEDDGQGRVRWMHWRGGLGNNQDVQQLGHGVLR